MSAVIGLLPKVIVKTTSKGSSNFIAKLFKNRGVQAGTGLAAIGGGIAVLGAGTRSATGEFSPIFSPIIVIAVIIIILIMVMKR